MRDLSPEHYGVGAGAAVPRLHVVSEQTRQAFLRWSRGSRRSSSSVAARASTWRGSGARGAAGGARAQWGLPDGETVVTSVARLGAMKGLDNLLLAAPRVLERAPNVRFVIAGEGDQRSG